MTVLKIKDTLKNEFADKIRNRLNGKKLTFDEVCIADVNQRLVNTRSNGKYDLFTLDELNEIRKRAGNPQAYCKKSRNKDIPDGQKAQFYTNITHELIISWQTYRNNINDCNATLNF